MFGRNKKTTKVVINFDVGFPNTLYLRGKGIPGLSWEKGIPLKNTKKNEWVFETESSFQDAEFKILINDKTYELGDNHRLTGGANIRITPKF